MGHCFFRKLIVIIKLYDEYSIETMSQSCVHCIYYNVYVNSSTDIVYHPPPGHPTEGNNLEEDQQEDGEMN